TQNMMNTKPANKNNPHYEFSQITAQIVTNGIQESYVNAAKDAANQYSVPVADCFSIWKELYEGGVDTDRMLSNGVNHPTRDAHKIFADELYKVMFGKI
ncbi:MAG TPA: GDSL family lipase, partial [Clostridia bacterium]|nr:GDSL family lipase [Clostridia bacterium]